jgi:hypothetical protein
MDSAEEGIKGWGLGSFGKGGFEAGSDLIKALLILESFITHVL